MKNLDTKLKLHIGGDEIKKEYLVEFSIQQEFNDHHKVKCLLYAECLPAGSGGQTMDKSKTWIGKTISFDAGEDSLQFEGLICKVHSVFDHMEYIYIEGYSPTILLCSVAGHYQSFNNLTLDQLVKKVQASSNGNGLKWKINPSHSHKITYISQYNEDHFNFLNRISASYGEFFFYDGRQLNFGKPEKSRNINLEYEKDIDKLTIKVQAHPMNYGQYTYNYRQAHTINSKSPEISLSNELAKHAYEKSKLLFKSSPNAPVEMEPEDEGELIASQAIKKKALASGLLLITGESSKISLGIGCHLHAKRTIGNKVSELGKFLITKIQHKYKNDSYSNTFTGVLAETEVLEVENVVNPIAEEQVGFVIANDDPQELGRVRVRMLWQNETTGTDWIRILTPHAGKDQRGIVFVPMKDDEVIVGFLYGNPDLPFVIGSVVNATHGNISPQKQSIRTASGSELVFFKNDQEEYITLSDKAGNQITVNNANNSINILSKGDIMLVSDEQIAMGGKNINISAHESLSLNTNDLFIDSRLFAAQIRGMFSVDAGSITEEAHFNFICIAGGNIEHTSKEKLTYRSEEESITIDALETVTIKGKVIQNT